MSALSALKGAHKWLKLVSCRNASTFSTGDALDTGSATMTPALSVVLIFSKTLVRLIEPTETCNTESKLNLITHKLKISFEFSALRGFGVLGFWGLEFVKTSK